MRIDIGRVEIHNFMSYSDEVIDFSEHKGMNLICGKNNDVSKSSNGSGKSACLNALIYGLYGTMPYKLKNENICNRYLEDKNMRVVVNLKADGKKYKIVSGLNRGKQSICFLYSIDENGNETDITKSTIAETREYIASEILNGDLSQFMRTTVLNSDPMYNFYNLNRTDKKNFIEKMFDLVKFSTYYSVIHRDVLDLDKDINARQNRLMILNKNDEEYLEKSKQFDVNKENEVRKLTEELETKTKELENKRSKIVKKNTELIEKCNSSIAKVDSAIILINEKIQKCNYELDALKGSVKRYDSMISDRSKIISKHAELKSKLCDDCKGIFSKYYNLDKYQSEIEKLESKKKSDSEKMSTMMKDKDELANKKKECTDKKTELTLKLKELNSEYDRQQLEIKNGEREIGYISGNLKTKMESHNPYVSLYDENKKRMEEDMIELENVIVKYNHTKFLEETVSQDTLKRFIIKDLIGVLNNRIKHYLHNLGANYDIVFDEDMNYEFITTANSRPEFHNFSSGEQARISIATCFAFRDFLATRSNITSNILILDEFIDSNIDSLAIENILEILKDFVERNEQNVYVVSHRTEVSTDYFDKIIQVEKNNNISHITYIDV